MPTVPPRPSRRLATAPARLGGAVLATAVRGLAAARPARKPMHPTGRVLRGRLERHGLEPGIGVPFVDRAGVDEVLVRESRGIGLPARLPDVHGLAIQVPLDDRDEGHADLLFSTNGWGPVTRFLVLPSAGMDTRPLTTLVPYRSPTGPLLIGARYAAGQLTGPAAQRRVELAVARPRSDWRVFAYLHLEPLDPARPDADDPEVEFDPVVHELPGLANYEWVRRLREPSYRIARLSRR